MSGREYFGIAKIAAYTALWLVLVYVLARLVVASLWGSASNAGMAAAVGAGVGGFLGLVWLARFFFLSAAKDFSSEIDE